MEDFEAVSLRLDGLKVFEGSRDSKWDDDGKGYGAGHDIYMYIYIYILKVSLHGIDEIGAKD